MTKKLPSLALFLCAFPALARADTIAPDVAAASPAPAAVVRQAAEDQAAKEGKVVFLEFHASWCIWCKRLNAMFEDPLVKPVWDKYFVNVEVDVLERAGKTQLENAGWQALADEYKATKAGLPYFVFLDPKGTVLGDSRDPDNMGYPGGKHDSAAFLAVIAKSAPSITRDELNILQAYLDKNSYGAD